MSRVSSTQLADEIVGEDQVVILFKEDSELQLVPLPGLLASDLDPSLVAMVAEILSVAQERPGERLSAGELGALERYPSGSREEVTRSLARAASIRQGILDAALTGAEAAKRLGVGTSRIRQRIGDHTLYAVKSGRAWRLPEWQFTRHGEVSGIAAVIQALPDEIGLLEVDSFLNSPNVDFIVGDVAVTPLTWLAAGHDPEPVMQIAADL